jgi:hypothetical protein
MEDKFKFENKNEFNIILIKPCIIDNLDWNDLKYSDNISNLDIYEDISCNSENFIDIIYEKLLISKYDNNNLEVNTQIINELPNFIYELLYIENFSENEFNGVATLLNTNGEKIYGNAILMKTFLPSLSNSILIVDSNNKNIKDILDSRVNINIVIYENDEWYNKKIKGNFEDFTKTFFEDRFYKCEISFLLHNINIWYEICDGCSKNTCGNILEKPIYKCFWFTKINDEIYGNLLLDEVKKIIKISNVLNAPFLAKPEWITDEIDEIKRKIIKNKYKILDLAYNELICNTI